MSLYQSLSELILGQRVNRQVDIFLSRIIKINDRKMSVFERREVNAENFGRKYWKSWD
jgi:hypothetical protein